MFKKDRIMFVLLTIFIFNIIIISDVYVRNNKKVEKIITGEFTISKDEKSFKNATVVIKLYKIDRYLADAPSDYVTGKTVKNFSHTKGKDSVIKFSFKDTDYTYKVYSLYGSIYIGKSEIYENKIFTAVCKDGSTYGKIKSDKEHIEFIAKKIKDYPENGKIKLPVTYSARIPWHPLFKRLPIRAKYTIYKNEYKLNLYGAKSEKELLDNLNIMDKTKRTSENYPPIELDIVVEIMNVTDYVVEMNLTNEFTSMNITSTNPNFRSIQTADSYLTNGKDPDGEIIKLKPKEKYKWKLNLRSGYSNSVYNYFTKKGEYCLKFVKNVQVRKENKFRILDIKIEIPEIYITIK